MRPRHLAPLLVTLALSADMATAEPVKGRVSDGAGRPIGGVEVRVESAGPPAAVTGTDGAFALAGLAPRRDLELSFCHRRYLPATLPLREAPEAALAVTLAAGAEIAGRVTDTAGAPVAGAQEPEPGPEAGGSRCIRPLSVAQVEPAPSAEPEGPELRLPEEWTVSGRLLGIPDDNAGGSTFVSAAPQGTPSSRGISGKVDEDGSYRISGLGAGVWNLTAWSTPGVDKPVAYRKATGTVLLGAGETTASLDLDFRLGDLTVTGVLTAPEGTPDYPTFRVALVAADGAFMMEAVQVWEGRFLVPRLLPGAYRLEVWEDEKILRAEQEIELTGDREVAIDLEAKP